MTPARAGRIVPPMPDDDGLTVVFSAWNGARAWRYAGLIDVAARDGPARRLQWQGACVVCGGSVAMTTPIAVRLADRAFARATCAAHRMTSAEAGRLCRAQGRRRDQEFARIKAAKLAARPAEPSRTSSASASIGRSLRACLAPGAGPARWHSSRKGGSTILYERVLPGERSQVAPQPPEITPFPTF